MTIAYIDVTKAPVQVPVIDLLQEPQGAAFDFISGQAWIVDKLNPANTMLRNIGDVLTNPGASPTKLLRRKSGLLESAPWWANEYDLAGNPMGMRTEAQRANRMTFSSDMSQRVLAGATVNLDAGLAPDGTMTADEFVAQPGVTLVRSIRNVGASVTTVAYTRSIFVKKTPSSPRYISLASEGMSNIGIYFDWNTLTTTAQGAAVLRHGVVAYSDGWYRIDYSWMGGSSSVTGQYLFLSDRANAAWGAASVGGESILVWGDQFEDAPFPSSYIPTGAAAVTRAADAPQIVTGFLPFNPTAGTLIMDGMAYDYDGTTNFNALNLSSGGNNNNTVRLAKEDTGAANASLLGSARKDSVGSIIGMGNRSFPTGPSAKSALSWDGVSNIVASGITQATQEGVPSVVPHSWSRLEFAPANGIMWYRSGIYIPHKLTAAELLARVRA